MIHIACCCKHRFCDSSITAAIANYCPPPVWKHCFDIQFPNKSNSQVAAGPLFDNLYQLSLL